MGLYSISNLKVMNKLHLHCMSQTSCLLSPMVHIWVSWTDKNNGVTFNKKHIPETQHITGWQKRHKSMSDTHNYNTSCTSDECYQIHTIYMKTYNIAFRFKNIWRNINFEHNFYLSLTFMKLFISCLTFLALLETCHCWRSTYCTPHQPQSNLAFSPTST